MKTIIIGGVAGGATAAARLRRLDEKAEIIILERGEYVSFANCGLPYYIGGIITDREDLTLQTSESFKARFNIEVRVLNEAVKINPDSKTITVKNLHTGETYEESYDMRKHCYYATAGSRENRPRDRRYKRRNARTATSQGKCRAKP